ncbi:hypothetical protein ADM98_07995 [Exiguobacterium sp. BMC-KP]|nr:hypothetical protein ADM98_07995 [Exiguobacterium sp. BMC-KP]
MENKKYQKNLITIRLVATLLILLSLILPYFEMMKYSTAPFVILIIFFVFYVMENKYGKNTVSK